MQLNRISGPRIFGHPSALHSHAAGVAEKGADCFHEVAEAAAATWGGPEGHVYRSVDHAEVEAGEQPSNRSCELPALCAANNATWKCSGGQAKRCSSLLRWDAFLASNRKPALTLAGLRLQRAEGSAAGSAPPARKFRMLTSRDVRLFRQL